MAYRVRLLLMAITGFFIFGVSCVVSAEWVYSGYGIKETYARIVLVDPNDNDIVYASTDYFLYISQDKGQSWKEIFTTPGKENTINFIAVSKGPQPVIFVATKEGLYASVCGEEKWERIYYATGANANNISCIALDVLKQDFVYITTGEGVFVSPDKGKRWNCISTTLGTVYFKYLAITAGAGTIYVSSDERIFKSEDSGATWQNIYATVRKDTTEEISGEALPQETEEAFVKINSLALNPDNQDEIYAATSKVVLVSKNKGKDFEFMTGLGLDNSEVTHIVISFDQIYAANYKGVFKYNKSQTRWIELYKGASFRDVRFLDIDSKDNMIWAAASGGVFKAHPVISDGASQDGPVKPGELMQIPQHILRKFNNEPSIAEVQRVAIKYAEVHPNKIKNWRRQARARAFLPEFSLDYDKTIYGSVSGSSSNFIVGPKDWGVGLKWDIGDFIFSDDQTNIDVRSRLMVQLRDDILDDVTRLYYERRRLQVELLTSPPKSEKERYDKLLRLEELTAGIDALTSGYFSANIRRD